MPVTSTVQTPQLFRGSLKGYQLKGLQWLVNCYEQVVNLIGKCICNKKKILQLDSFHLFVYLGVCCCL